jgi:hypothetical protein
MGAGSNAAVLFVVVSLILVLFRFWMKAQVEVPMENTIVCRKAKPKTKSTVKRVLQSFYETSWEFAINFAVGLVTLSIHAKGALRNG